MNLMKRELKAPPLLAREWEEELESHEERIERAEWRTP